MVLQKTYFMNNKFSGCKTIPSARTFCEFMGSFPVEKKILEDKIKKAHLKFPNIIERRLDLNIKSLLLFRFLFHAMMCLFFLLSHCYKN